MVQRSLQSPHQTSLDHKILDQWSKHPTPKSQICWNMHSFTNFGLKMIQLAQT